jgi:hypothetical protein
MVDNAIDAYVAWRLECGAVWEAYDRWACARSEDTVRAHAAYHAALDREEAAAKVYAKLMAAVGELYET